MEISVLLGLAIVWLILQGLAFRLFAGGWRIAAWVSGGAMLLAVAVAVLGGLAGSNLAPIWIVLALPLCTVWIIGLWIVHGIAALLAK